MVNPSSILQHQRGKRDEDLILPINSSLSVTLNQEQLRTKTTISASRKFSKDRMWLNGCEQSLDNKRLQNVIQEIRRRARKRKVDTDALPTLDWHIHICSENNFPTAAGLASSAAGFACLVFTLAKLYGIKGDISDIARQGSGSACRSVYGGFVAWDMGEKADGTDSLARQVAPETHWPDLRVLILVVSAKKKHVGSTSGMQTTVQTSALLSRRVDHTVPERMVAMTTAVLERDYDTFAAETMKDSNQMHAVCLDTSPPIAYLTDTSHDIIRMVHAINKHYGQTKVCYTYDAGPNACLYLPQDSVAMVMSVVQHLFPPQTNGDTFIRGLAVDAVEADQALLDSLPVSPSPGAVQYVISTKAGPGPQVLDNSESLLTDKGLPINVSTAGLKS